MRALSFLLVLGLAGAAIPVHSEPLDRLTVITNLNIERERDAQCSDIRAGAAGAQPPLAMTDVCHGWTAASCLDMLVVHGNGVTQDQAQVLFAEPNKALDLAWLVDLAIRAQWPGHELLHLQFGAVTCGSDSLRVAVSGSHLKAGSPGAAAGFHGDVRIRTLNDHQVTIRSGK